jgi:hypothetical protein
MEENAASGSTGVFGRAPAVDRVSIEPIGSLDAGGTGEGTTAGAMSAGRDSAAETTEELAAASPATGCVLGPSGVGGSLRVGASRVSVTTGLVGSVGASTTGSVVVSIGTGGGVSIGTGGGDSIGTGGSVVSVLTGGIGVSIGTGFGGGVSVSPRPDLAASEDSPPTGFDPDTSEDSPPPVASEPNACALPESSSVASNDRTTSLRGKRLLVRTRIL